ncbi:MAG: GAF domain-containing protein [Sandaracinaceae bacterium]|nr:GAF domain-containing protein [Sandaracinaceae bacterium]
MDLRTQTSLLAAVLSFAIASTVLLRARRRRVHWFFALFGATVGAWYLSTFLVRFLGGGPLWERLNVICAVLLPLSAVQFFRTFLQPESRRANQLQRTTVALALAMIGASFTPVFHQVAFAGLIFTYVFVLMGAALVMLFRASRVAASRFERARLTYLFVVLALAAVFTLAEYLPYAGLEIPPVGAILILVFLYVLSQSILRYRLLDLYELAGRLTLLTALSFSLAGILWVLVLLDPGHFFLHSVVAALVLFLLFDPLRARLEQQIALFFFRERSDLERLIGEIRAQLAHTLSMDEMTQLVMSALGGSRRLTDASIYLLDERGSGFELGTHIGREPIGRLELAFARPLVDRLRRDEELVIEQLERELDAAHELGEELEVKVLEEIIATLEAMHASVVVALRGHDETYGLLCVRDDRLRDAFSPEEVQLLRGLAAQASIAIENSRLYQRLRQRDRLAELGGMAAGLAHEIRNPLGAIKASAQFLAEPGGEPGAREFLDIIVEETDRLNRVVSSFLDYARPSPGDAAPTDINAAVQRTLTLLGPDLGDVEIRLELASPLPRVRIDAERLRQVLINLCQNAAQAMEGTGQLTVRTVERTQRNFAGEVRHWIELSVADTGPGIPQKILSTLFVPFVTTKDRGTGLGLAISQRIVSSAGGDIEARSAEGVGSTFVVRLPVAEEREPTGELAAAARGALPASFEPSPSEPSPSEPSANEPSTSEPSTSEPTASLATP